MKKFIFLIVFLAVVAGVLIATCPDRNAHMAAIKSVVSEVVNDEVDKQTNIFTTELASISTVLTVNMADSYLKTNLIIKDHTLYNIGYINYKDEPNYYYFITASAKRRKMSGSLLTDCLTFILSVLSCTYNMCSSKCSRSVV